MGDGGFNPCECIMSHEFAMRRLISLLRNSQTYCTDAECFQELPGPQSTDTATDGGFNVALFTMAWVVIAITLYFMRPQSAQRNDQKPRSNQGPSGGSPPPPNMPIQ